MAEQISDKDLSDIMNQIEGQFRDPDRMRIIKRVALNYKMSCAQLKTLVASLRFAVAVDNAVLLYPQLTDPQNFGVVLDSYQYPEDRELVKTRLNLK